MINYQYYCIPNNFSFQNIEVFQIIRQNKNSMNKIKKTAGECNRKKKIYDKITAYFENPTKAQQDNTQTLEEYLLSNDLNVSFNQLHNYIDKTMINQQRKNMFLEDGVYILLEGSVTYTWTKNKHDRDRKDHLICMARTGTFSNLSQFSPDRQNILASGYSILINTPFAVLESQCGNINTNDQCIFLKLPIRVLQLTDFYKIKTDRIDIFTKAKLPGIRNYSTQSIVAINHSLHHTFKLRRMVFRNKFQISSLGIIINGSAKIKTGSNNKKIQFTKFCILLANFEYEVSSAQIQIIEVIKNPTLNFKRSTVITRFVEEITRSSEIQENQEKNSLSKYRKKIAASVSMHKQKSQKISRAKQERKKKKQFSLFSKQCQTFCIVPMQFCKQNLSHIRSVKKKTQLQQKNKKPRALFNFSKKQLFSMKEGEGAMGRSGSSFLKINNSLTMGKSQLMQRYEVYAKDIYQQFKKHKQQKNYSSLVLATGNHH